MKKVLLISYFFPPLPSQRCVKFVKYLPEYGWTPWVLAPEQSKYPRSDSTLLGEVPACCTVVKVPSSESTPGALVRPDDFKSGWYPESIMQGLRIIEEQKIDVIYSTASPNLSHLIGLALKKMTGTPWVADFRDEWTTNPYIQGKYPGSLVDFNRRLESEVLQEADAVVGISEKMTSALFELSRLPARNKFMAIHEGFDPPDFQHVERPERGDKFRLAYMGALYGLRKELLDKFLSSLNQSVKTGDLPATDLELHMIGDPLALPVKDRLFPIKNFGHLPHHAALSRVRQTDLLMLFIDPREGLQTVPSKLFEYLMLQRPILAIIPEQSEVADIIRQTQSGVVVDSRAPEKAVNEIKQQLDLWKTNASSPWSPDMSEIDKFNRRYLTGRLAEVLNQIKGLQRM